ncbi:TonB-dependent receptor [Parvularcula bermudensis HTCC2503]|uniref:TonB-dependent receptor n=1 Tax=Parvularcula bermudensis (strain ATCC BAA-594 / HTCC2503 / KCTC 12087) TaxID=314260 RepID=E0TE91_PARBH|nr:TonB-dependent receptor [Parvularcula bermudensis]ADM09466.1 TonB-dependent receptor [Parvularcula bermudensis HTCC2503]
MKHSISLLCATSALCWTAAVAAEIDGRVTNSDGDVALRGAQVTLVDTGRTVTTDRDGGFRFAGLAAGEYTLEISYVGTPTQTVTVTLDDAADTAMPRIALADGEDIFIVEGQIGQLNAALSQQKAADGIKTVLSADAIASLPDENVAEAARRALGVSVANDQGEGRFITVRGISSQLNSTSVNGVRLTSPEAGDRRIGLDVVDADILKNIVINKSLLPDMDGDAIGGSIELETISGLDRDSRFTKLKLGYIYSEFSEEFGPKVSGTYTDRFADGRLGVALSGSFQNREFATENKEVDGEWVTDEALPYPEEQLELRNYDVERERLSLAANFDFMATEDLKLYVHSLFNDFSDQEYRSRVEVDVEDADFAFDTDAGIVTASDASDTLRIDRDIKDRLEEQQIWSVVTGFEKTKDVWTIDGSVAFTHAEEAEPNRLDTNFRRDFEGEGVSIGIDVNDPVKPRLVNIPGGYLDASQFEFDAIELTNGETEDEELALTFNVQRDVEFGRFPGFVKVGAKSRMRDKSYDLDFDVYEAGDDLALTLADVATTVDYPLDVFGPAPSVGAVRDFFFTNVGNEDLLEFAEDDSIIESAVSSYDSEEDILAGYLMGQIDIDNVRITGGVRVEQTDFSVTGNVVDEEDTGTIVQTKTDNDYTDVLPSVALRWAVSDDFIVRASYFESIIRPNFGQATPAGVINEDLELEVGNPDLERTEAANFDLLFEYYPSASSVLQAGLFYKDLENLITGTTSNVDGVFNGLAYDEISTFQNIDDAEVIGIEVGYQQALTFLPAPWDGFLVAANWTYTDSEATIRVDEDGDDVFEEIIKIAVPGQSDHIVNAIVGYDKGRWDLRAALSYKGENIDDVDIDGSAGDGRIIPEQTFLDLSAKYEVTDRLKVYGELDNVLDTEFQVTQNGGLLSQFEEYGLRAQGGIIFKF